MTSAARWVIETARRNIRGMSHLSLIVISMTSNNVQYETPLVEACATRRPGGPQ